MPKSVQVDGIGVVEFGDDFTEAEIGAQVGKLYEKQSQDRLNVRPVNKPIDPGFRLRDTAGDTYEAQLKASGISPAEAKRAQAAGDLRQEQSFEELPDSGEGGTWAKAGWSVVRGTAELSESLNRGLGSLGDYIANSTPFAVFRGTATGPAQQKVGEVGEYLTDTANEVRKTVKDAGLVEQATPGNQFVSAVAGGAPSLVPSLASAPVAGLPILMAGFQSYGSVLGDAEEGFRKQGLPADQVRERGRKVAALSGLTTSVLTFGFNRFGPGLEKWTQGMNSPVGRAGLKELGREFGHEFTEEGLDQFAQGVVARHSYEPHKSWEQIVRESLAAGVAGGTLAGGLKGVTGIDERMRLMRDLAKDDKQFHRMSMRVANDAANLAGLPPTMATAPAPVDTTAEAPRFVVPESWEPDAQAGPVELTTPPPEFRNPEPLPPGVTLVPPGEVPVVPPGSATFDAGASGTVVFDPAKVTLAAVSVIIDSLPPQAEPTTTSNEAPRQPSARPPGVDVREPTATGPAAPQGQQTAPAPGEEGSTGAAPGGPTQGGTGDGRGGSVPGGDGKRARPGGRPGDGGQPTGPAAAPGAGTGVEGAGPKLTAKKRAEYEAELAKAKARLAELEEKGDAAISPNDPGRVLWGENHLEETMTLARNHVSYYEGLLKDTMPPTAPLATPEEKAKGLAEALARLKARLAEQEKTGAVDDRLVEQIRNLEKLAAAPAPETGEGGQVPDFSAIDFSPAAAAARLAVVWGAYHPVGAGSADGALGRWHAIENTYIGAAAAEKALPGVPLKDAFAVTIKQSPGAPNSPKVDHIYVAREHLSALLKHLETVYPAGQFTQQIDTSHKPYVPRKGEPSYKEWLQGVRPTFSDPSPEQDNEQRYSLRDPSGHVKVDGLTKAEAEESLKNLHEAGWSLAWMEKETVEVARERKERERIAAGTKTVGDTAAEQDHVIPAEGDYFPKGDKAKVRANLEAIALLRRLEAENRNATPEEKAKLAQYVGWGGLQAVFDDGKAAYRKRPPTFQMQKDEFENWEHSWGKQYDEVNNTLTPEERAAAMKSIRNAHFTVRHVISAVWAGAQRLGFKGGVVLEPAAGVLHFAGLMPEALRGKVKWNAVEQDSVSARIAAKLYPNARVQHAPFEKSRLGPNSQDIVIGNVPFASDGPIDKRYPSMSLHNYFFARALDVVKPGGIVAMITSDSTMDSGASRAAREYFATKADLVGAVRLPNNAFKANAGTEVTTDILYFRKRDDKPFVGEPFLRTVAFKGSKGEELQINEYFAAHPEMMLGRMSKEGTMYGPEQQALLPTPGADLAKLMAEAMARLPADVMGAVPVQTVEAAPVAEKSAKLGRLFVKDGHAWQVQPDGTLAKMEWSEKPKTQKKRVEQVAAYVGLMDQARATLAQMNSTEATEAEMAASRAMLNKLYDAYHAKYKALNLRGSSFLDDDVDFPFALSLEDGTTQLVMTEGGKARRETTWTKSEMFRKRTIFPRVAPSRVDTVEDAVQVSQNFQGKVDVAYIAQLTGKPMEAVAEELEAGGMAYENPATGGWENRATYLSGFVKVKLAAARFAAEEDPRFARHVAELEKVQPPDIAIEHIGVKLGSTWVPEGVIAMFLRDQLGVTAEVSYTPLTGDWTVKPSAGAGSERNRNILGIHDWKGHELVERSLNLKSPTVTKMVPKDGGGTQEVRDPGKTLEAQQKQQALQKMFKQFVLGNPKVGAHLQKIYNDQKNGVVAPKFEGPTWARYPGASEDILLRTHQKGVVTRMIQNSTLLAHSVGTGKTYAMITAAMEMRRLGLAQKPMIVVQNATLEQFGRSAKRLYPAARILMPNSTQRDSKNRNRTMSRIATGDWDIVLIPQSFVNLMPDDPVREDAYIKARIDELNAALITAAAEGGKKSPKAKNLQKAKDRLERKLEALADRKKDNVLTFEQLGVDALFVDEAHAYKKLEFSTKMENIKGLDTGVSERGWGMYMKTRWVQERNQGRNVIFATGTPVSNTIAEAWNMMRFVRPDVLKAYGMESFDEFASTFGEAFTKTEPTATGDWKPVTRFARFTNGPELIAAWLTTADVVMADQLNLPGLPSLKNGKPTTVNVPKTPDVANYIKYLQSELLRYAAMTGSEKRENSHIPLVVQTLARKAMADMRMIDPDLPDQPGSKLNEVVRRVLQVHRDSTSVKGTQMVFADLFQDNPKTPRFNLFEEMKRKLIEGGIPENEILIVDETVKEERRDILFKRLNDGEIRVALGSTERMGIGVNAQEHMIALHHVAPPHRPMDIEQRNGRLVRQGNQNPEVEIFNYGVSGSLDSAMYDLLATKQLFTNQLMRGDLQGRNFEDAANEASLSFEEAMAAFSDDPRARLKVGLQSQVRDLELLRSGHASQVRKSVETAEHLKGKTIPYQEKVAAEAARRAAAFAQAFGGKDFTLEAGGTTVTGRKEVAEALDRAFKAGIEATVEWIRKNQLFGAGHYLALGNVSLNGQEIELRGTGSPDSRGMLDPTRTKIVWKFVDGGMEGGATTGQGFLLSLTAALERIAGEPAWAAASLEGERRNLRELEGFITQPFAQEQELVSAKEKLAALEAELEAAGKAAPPSGQEGGEQTPPGASSDEDSEDGEAIHEFSGNTTLVAAAAADLGRIRNLVAPQTAGETARFAGNLLRELNAKMANELSRADLALRLFRADFDRTPVNLRRFKYDPTLPLPRNLAFIDAYESGITTSLAAGDQLAAAEFHRLNAADLARVQALGTGALTTFYTNYFPHIWQDPKAAAVVMARLLGKAPLEGPKAFLKQRTHQLFVDGLAAGLKPVHDNPVDLWLLKKREIERYILAHDFVREMKEAGLVKFKYAFAKAPEGWATVNDRAFTVYGPPTVTIKEAFDAGMREATLDLLHQLGVPHERLARIGGRGRWGYEVDRTGVPGTERIVTRFGGPDFVIWHELGHALHNRYADLQPLLNATALLQSELAALATARTSRTSPQSFKINVQTMPEKMAVVLQAYVHAPDEMARLAPTVKAAFESFLVAHPELAKINDIMPGLRLGVGEAEISHGGLLKLGDWVMPEAAAKVVNNFLSPGLNTHLWYRTIRETSNLLNSVQLGLSAFHLGFTSLDAATSRLAVGLEDLAAGKPLSSLATIISTVWSPVTNIRTGAKLRAEVLRPGTYPAMASLARALERGGGRVAQDSFWQTEFTRRMKRAWHEGGLQWATLPIRFPLAAWEQTMRPILEYIVPRQKLGVFADMAKRELVRLGPAATAADVRLAMQKAWDSVDNRMGQVVYDNLFYNRAVKDVALISFRAFGWQLGKYREALGAIIDTGAALNAVRKGEKPEFSHRMAYVVALPLMVGTLGALLQYLFTGKPPEEARDYFQPKTGELDRNGNPVRVNLPSYVKDILSYAKHPVTSFVHSLNPMIAAVFDLLQNKDFYNTEIRHPDDPLWKQGTDVAAFAAKQFVPFSVSGAMKLAEDDAPAWKRIAPFFGVTPVPQRMTMSPSQALASEIMAGRMPAGARTKEKFDESKLRAEALDLLKRGQREQAKEKLRDAIDARALTTQNLAVMIQKLAWSPYQFQVHMMASEDAMRVWRIATPAERASVTGIVMSKIANSKTLTPAEKLQYGREVVQGVGVPKVTP